MTHDPSVPGTFDPQHASTQAVDAGAMLRGAREAAGMSLDIVSAQLKLAPRQVKALEDGDFDLLPGRTFVRGFARNYARLMHLDPATVLEALPGATTPGGLEAPPLHPTTGTMGELPSNGNPRPALLRWAIAGVILVILIAAGTYEYLRETRKPPGSATPDPAVTTNTPAADTSTPLPSPLNATSLEASGNAGTDANKSSAAAAPSAAAASTGIAPIRLALRGSSWVEIRDSTGRVVLSQTVPAGQTQMVLGTPPFDVVIGNAREVTLTFRGRTLDLAPYTNENVVRMTLQ